MLVQRKSCDEPAVVSRGHESLGRVLDVFILDVHFGVELTFKPDKDRRWHV